MACAQFDNLKAAVLDITQQHTAPHNGPENEQLPTAAHCDLQAKLNECIRHHQEVMA